LKSSPDAKIHLVAIDVSAKIFSIAQEFPQVTICQKAFEVQDVIGKSLVIAATSFHEVNMQVYHACQSQGILINVADTPELCDFYLGSIVTKGDLKIAISTNGKSPTFAKRFRELLEENLPDSIDGILSKLSEIRNKLSGDFQSKVQKLDEITDILKDKGDVLEEK
jgi:precorrin-2 dehydrogenase/sirohydrochlorin ferrochelatase